MFRYPDSVDSLCSLIRNNNTLITIDISTNSISDEEMVKLIPSLKQNLTLKKLDISYHNIHEESTFEAIERLESKDGCIIIGKDLVTGRVNAAKYKNKHTLPNEL